MTLDERIEQEVAKNPGLKKLFEKYPEKKELYKQKILDSENASFGCNKINPKYCRTCIFKNGEPPFADSPEKVFCMIYTYENGVSKPKAVYYDGQLCEYYADENTVDEEDAE